MVDVLIPLGNGSKFNNSELRFALRSIARNVSDLGRVFVATVYPPDWLQGVEIVPIPDLHLFNKDANLFDKILRVCQLTDISDEFLVWSDDQVALKPVDLTKLNIYNRRNLDYFTKKTDKWSGRMINTLTFLRSQGIELNYNWDSHTPHLYRKEEVIRILESVNYADLPGYCLDTLLCGMMKRPPEISQDDVKYNAEKEEQANQTKLIDVKEHFSWIGYNDTGFRAGVYEWLSREFCGQSRFEKYPEIDVVVTYVDPTDKDWQQTFERVTGVKNSENHCRYRNFENFQYLLRGIEKFMPWVRKLWVVVDNEKQVPEWLNVDNPQLQVVYHRQFIPGHFLPTFNACLIELFFHRIKGLAEHFIYLNDDMFPMSEISPDCFFDEFGMARISHNPRTPKTSNQFQKLLNNNEKLMKKRYGMEHGYTYNHIGYALIRSAMEDVIEDNYSVIEEAMSESPMRTEKNFMLQLVNNYLIYMHYSAEPVIRGRRVELKDGQPVKKYPHEQIVCYNDNKALDKDYERVKKELNAILEELLPERSKFEMACGCKNKVKLIPKKQMERENKKDTVSSSEALPDDKPSPRDPIVQRRFWDSLAAYAAATYEWYKAGKPSRTAEEMLECFMTCQQCPYFEPIDEEKKRGRCGICGCYLGVNPHRFLEGNKIAMKTQSCPDGRWS